MQAVPKNSVQETLLQRLLEETIGSVLRMPGQELCAEATCRESLSISAPVAEEASFISKTKLATITEEA
jgi:hypothetical protein